MFGRPNSLLKAAPPKGPSVMIESGVAMREGAPYLASVFSPVTVSESFSKPCGSSGRLRFEVVKPQRPAFGRAPRPVAPSSRISPPEPVEAPGNGEMAVGWLWVSTLKTVWVFSSRRSKTRPNALPEPGRG